MSNARRAGLLALVASCSHPPPPTRTPSPTKIGAASQHDAARILDKLVAHGSELAWTSGRGADDSCGAERAGDFVVLPTQIDPVAGKAVPLEVRRASTGALIWSGSTRSKLCPELRGDRVLVVDSGDSDVIEVRALRDGALICRFVARDVERTALGANEVAWIAPDPAIARVDRDASSPRVLQAAELDGCKPSWSERLPDTGTALFSTAGGFLVSRFGESSTSLLDPATGVARWHSPVTDVFASDEDDDGSLVLLTGSSVAQAVQVIDGKTGAPLAPPLPTVAEYHKVPGTHRWFWASQPVDHYQVSDVRTGRVRDLFDSDAVDPLLPYNGELEPSFVSRGGQGYRARLLAAVIGRDASIQRDGVTTVQGRFVPTRSLALVLDRETRTVTLTAYRDVRLDGAILRIHGDDGRVLCAKQIDATSIAIGGSVQIELEDSDCLFASIPAEHASLLSGTAREWRSPADWTGVVFD